MNPRNASCSFCCKSYTEVGPLVEGPGEVYICGDCTELSQSIIDQERRRRGPPRPPVGPEVIREKLNQLVNGQDEAKSALALAADSRNEGGVRVLLIGPTSSSKILLAKALAHVLEAPFAAGDSSDLFRSHHASGEVVPLLFRLLQASDFDLAAAQRGVVFVDGVERPEAQQALLRLWQNKLCRPVEGLELDLRGILFVCAGSFTGLDESITRWGRHVEQPVRAEDLTVVGVRPEWAGCLTGIARVGPLDEDTLVRIMAWVDFHRRNGEQSDRGLSADGPSASPESNPGR